MYDTSPRLSSSFLWPCCTRLRILSFRTVSPPSPNVILPDTSTMTTSPDFRSEICMTPPGVRLESDWGQTSVRLQSAHQYNRRMTRRLTAMVLCAWTLACQPTRRPPDDRVSDLA